MNGDDWVNLDLVKMARDFEAQATRLDAGAEFLDVGATTFSPEVRAKRMRALRMAAAYLRMAFAEVSSINP